MIYKIYSDFKAAFVIAVFFSVLTYGYEVSCFAQEDADSKIIYFQDVNNDNTVISLTNNRDMDDFLTIRTYDENQICLGVFFRMLEAGETDILDLKTMPEDTSMLAVEFNGDISFQRNIMNKEHSARSVTNNCFNGKCITISSSGCGSVGNTWLNNQLTLTMTPCSGYAVDKVLVDGVSVGAPTVYQSPAGFIGNNHTIEVFFKSVSVVSTPAAATSLQATTLSSSSIKVTWRDNSSNESGFYIWRWNSQWTLAGLVSANTTSYTDTGLAAGTTYYYTVQPYNSAGATDAGYNVSARTSSSAVTKPAAATNLQATTLSSSSIKVTWRDNSSNESGFYIWRWNSQWTLAAQVSANTTSYTDTGLAAGTTYYYTVQPYNSAGATDAGYNVSARTSSSAVTKPAAATSLQATTLSSSSIKVTWRDNSSNESGFYIWRWNSQWTLAAQVSANTTSYTDTGLAAGTTYYYTVQSYNSAGATDAGYNVSARTSSSSSGGYTKPYILKNGCTFTLYTNGGTSTVTSSSSGSSTSTLQSNGIQIIIKNCVITSNPQNVPVYGQ